MKKIISSLLVVIVLFNFIFCCDTYALDFEGTDSVTDESVTAKDQEGLINEGKVEDKSGMLGGAVDMSWNIVGAMFEAIAGILATVANLFPLLMQYTISFLSGSGFELFTIERAVFNEIPLFNINYFNFSKNYKVGTGNYEKVIKMDSSISTSVKESVAKFFIIVRLIAIAISLLTLIYVGIRMAISTVASDKTKYKQMLIGWIESIVILFLMQYIISIIINLGEIFGNMIYNMKSTLASEEVGFETQIIDTMTKSLGGESGWGFVANVIPYWFLVFLQTKFFLSYFKRVVTVGFLILIAPIVTVTYPIDKAGDGKAQAFSVWFNELAINVFIQPIHALIYLIFIYTAGEIAKHSMIVALVFLLSLTKVEKMVLYLFNLKNVTSLRPVYEERKKEK